MRRVIATLALGVVIAGCSAVGLRASSPSALAELQGEPQIGVPYAVTVGTHCGLFTVEFDGSHWAISGVLSDGYGNPPPSFGNPADRGMVTLTSRDEAIWTSEFGEQRTLTRGGPFNFFEPPGSCY